MYVMAVSSRISKAASDGNFYIRIYLSNSQMKQATLSDPGGGKLWTLNNIFSGSCTTINQIQRVLILEDSNDGWNIGSVVTIVKDALGLYQILTRDFGINHWLDGNSGDSERRSVQLTMA